ncbi:MAG: hypothetical protein P8H03_11625 [Emcibacteraceae bacterium]|nr:hypothetical protein [Emcibacteraceae bacterium]MDG1859273.1 hypothetical protein [Emcibacteraceae bacterium]
MLLKPTFLFAIFVMFILNSITYAQDVQTGSFRITSTSEVILGKEMASDFEKQIAIDEEINWWTYVPKTYDSDNPPGILLYQTYRSNTEDPTGWKTAMDERNMILIRIIGKGGEYPQRKELFLSVLAPLVLQQRYTIDSSRIYTTADGGCINAGAMAQTYPNIVKGAIYVNCNPSVWRGKEPDLVDLMRQNRYYFIAARDRTQQIDNRQEIRKYKKAGIENVKFVRTGRLSRSENLNRNQLKEAIDYLDGNEVVAE